MPSHLTWQSSVRLPSDMVLTVKSIAAVVERFTLPEIGDLIEMLIAHVDRRDFDADREPEPEMCRV